MLAARGANHAAGGPLHRASRGGHAEAAPSTRGSRCNVFFFLEKGIELFNGNGLSTSFGQVVEIHLVHPVNTGHHVPHVAGLRRRGRYDVAKTIVSPETLRQATKLKSLQPFAPGALEIDANLRIV